MNRDWKDRMEKNPENMRKRVHAKDAYNSDSWIYSVKNDKWYTPAEFMASEETVYIHRGKEDEKQFRIMDPRAGLKQKLEQMKRLQLEVDDLARRIMDYYDFKNKPLKK